MTEPRPTAFLAYPSHDALIAETLAATGELSRGEAIEIIPWPKLDPYGLKIDDLIRHQLDKAALLIADITYPNFNVYYEIGYAIAQQKPVLLTVYNGAEDGLDNARLTGLFDNVGWAQYDNSAELIVRTLKWKQEAWVERYKKPRDYSQPLFIFDTYIKSNFRQYIFEAVANRSVNFRSFDPYQDPTLTVAGAIAEMTASSGCILPLLRPQDRDFQRHNLRCAFLAGCAHGLEISPLLIQYENSPAPLDYRDFIKNTKGQTETHKHVEEYCGEVLVRNQKASNRADTLPLSILNMIEIGNASAENETESLNAYFLETAEFRRAQRTDHALIIGRKGSGKTAILNQIKKSYSRSYETIIVELRPATHNLSEMRYHLLAVMNQGVFDHTVAAFWQYILYMEILLKIREVVLLRATRDIALQNRISAVEQALGLTHNFVAADFTSRLEDSIGALIESLKHREDATTVELTNILYEERIPQLRKAIADFSDQFSELVLLFDDLDKGWPPQQLENHDIMMIRHLVESLRRMERDLRRKNIPFKAMLFLRSDVYENLVEVTSDRNKQVVIKVDWTDKHQLTNLIKRRATHNFAVEEHDRVWQAFNPVLKDGHYAMERLVAGSLYRPRFLIELCEMMLAIAINRGANYVDDDDVDKALEQFSRYLVSEWGLELRDVSGVPKDIFYYFIGKPQILTVTEISEITKPMNLEIGIDKLVDLLLWYGFLGIAKSDNQKTFIFDCGYDFRRLQVDKERASEAFYCVNPAFLKGLEMRK